jgi:hypothetical protein
MDTRASLKWIKTSLLAAVGGGIAAMTAAAMDPTKYQFPRDFGTGKLWPYFFSGMIVTFGALSKHSIDEYRKSQEQLEADREALKKPEAQGKDKNQNL